MAIKLSGSTIIDDSRVIVNADKIGIGTTNPQVALEIFSGDVGIGTNNPTASNIEIALNNNTNVLAVGIVTADNIFGTFKGTIDEGTSIDRANRVKIISNADNAVKYLSFVDNTGANGFGTIFYNTNITYNPNFDGSNNGELNIDGNVKIDGRLSAKDFLNVESVGFVTAGTGLEVTQGGFVVTGPSTLTGNLIPGANDTYDIGKDPSVAGNYRWNKVYAKEYYGIFKGTVDPSVAADRIEEGNTKAEVVDTNGNGHFLVETENQERLRVTSTGDVGIGTTQPLNKFQVGIGTQAFNVTGVGSVGIGATLPSAPLQIYTTASQDAWKFRIDTDVSDGAGFYQRANGDFEMVLRDASNNVNHIMGTDGALTFTTSGTEKVRITSTGDVGIGTTVPTNPVLSTNDTILAVGFVTAREYYGTFKGTIDPSVADDKIQQGDTKAQVVDTGTNGHFLVETENQERLRVNDDGILLIGTNTPRNVGFTNQRGQLQIEGTSVNTSSFSLVNNQNTTQSPIILFGKTRGTSTGEVNTVVDGDTLGKIAFCPADGTDLENNTAQIKVVVNGTVSGNQIPTDITFETSPTNSANRSERLRITSTGNVGIGTTNPDAVVGSQNNAKLAVGIVTAREYYGTFKGTIDPSVADDKIQQGDTKAQVVDNGSNGYFFVETENTERLRIDNGGTVSFELPTTVSNNVTTTQSLILKNTTAATPRDDFYIDSDLKPISQIASTWNAYHSITRHDAADRFGPYLMLAKNRNDAYNSNTIVQNNDEFGNIAFLGNDGTRFREGARIRGEVDGTPASNQMPGRITFWTNNGIAVAEKVRITSDGDVGIGTNNPTGSNAVANNNAKLAVGIVTAREYYGIFKGTIDPSVADDKIQQGDTKAQVVDTGTNGHFLVETDGTERLRVTSDGKVGIGTNNPDELIEVRSANNPAIKIHNENLTGWINIAHRNNGDSWFHSLSAGTLRIGASNGTGKIAFYTDGMNDSNEKMRITNAGKVGIGTTNPDAPVLSSNNAKLAVGIVTAREFYGTFKGTVDPSVAADRIQEGNTKAEVVDNGSNGHFLVSTENQERLRVNESGHVGIGTDLSGSGTHKLHVFNGTGCGSQGSGIGEVVIESNNSATIQLLSPSGNVNPQSIYFGDESSGQVGRIQYDHSDDSMLFKTNGNNRRFRLNSSGDADFTGSVGIGTTNPDAPVLSSNNNKLAVGIVTAREYYGTFKGTVDPSVAADRIQEGNTSAEVVDTGSNGHFKVITEGDERLRITEDGRVGIGTVNPFLYTPFHVYHPTLNRVGIFESGDSFATMHLADKNGSIRFLTTLGTLKIGVGGTAGLSTTLLDNAFTIKNDGKVGIGTDVFGTSMSGKTDTTLAVAGIVTANQYYGTFMGTIDPSAVKTYALPFTVEDGTSGNGGNSGIATVILREVGNLSNDDPVTITAGSGIVIDSVTDGFKISADISQGGGNGISDVQVIQYSNNADPRSIRTSTNPIDVQKAVGIVTIGIGTTSNAYGNRFVGPNTPSGAVEGDIWYDTSTSGQGISRVAILKDEKGNQVNGGTFQSSGWKDRDLTVKEDPSNFVTFTATPSGQSTAGSGNTPGYWSLPAGNYKIDWSAPAHEVARHKTRLVYSTTESQISTAGLDPSASFVEGSASHTASTNVTTQSTGSKIINLSQTTWFKIMHYCSGNNTAGDGFGRRQSSNPNTDTGTNIYTQVRIEDLAAAIKDDGNTNKIIQGNTKAEVNDTNGNGHFLVETEGTERLRIDSSGRMGLGTNNPGQGNTNAKLDVRGQVWIGGSSEPVLRWRDGNNEYATARIFDNDLAFETRESGTDYERLRITQGGNVGIGTTIPNDPVTSSNTAKLVVGIVTCHEAYVNALNLNTSGAGVGDLLSNGGPDGIFGIYNTTNSGKTIFPVRDSGGTYNDILELLNDRAIIDGNVGIGSTIPKTKLDVHATDAIVVPVGTTAQRPASAAPGMFRYNSSEGKFEGYTTDWGQIGGSGSGGGNVATSIQTFTTAGSFTYTPTPGTTSIIVHCIGAGGASGTPATSAWTGGGGAGGVAIKTYNLVQLGSNASVVVPAASGYDTFPNANDGPNGGNASFNPSGTGPTIIGYGGTGSSAASGATGYSEGGDGGIGFGGDINLTGDKGYVVRDQYQPTSTLVAELRTNAGSSASSYHINRAKAAGGGYGQYGLGGEATFTNASTYNNGRGGTAGAVIIYEFAGSGSGGSGGGGSAIELLTEKTSTSGTEVEFTGIPSDAMEITLMFKGVSASGTNNFKIQLGTSSGYITSGYDSLSQNEGGGDELAATDCFLAVSTAAGHVKTGSMLIKKASDTSYVQTGQFAVSPQTNKGGNQTYGSLSSVSGTVDRLKIILSGSDTFDAGIMNVSYKTSGSGSDSTAAITKVAVLQDVRGTGTNGGTASTNSWHQRRLNSKIDDQNFVTLVNGSTGINGTANTFILGAGTYLLQWRAPGYDSGDMRAKMAYTTDANYNTLFATNGSSGVSYLGGESAQSEPTNESNVYATGSATITISQTTYFRLQHYVTNNNANNNNALGEAGNISGEDEIYSQVIVQDLETSSLSGGGANVGIGTTPPTSPSPNSGDLWWNSDNGDLHVYYPTQWVAVNNPPERIQKVSATGGTTDIVNGYKVHKFTTSGTFDVTASGEVEVLVVAGGGSEGGGNAGCHGGGGGGGGGVVRRTMGVQAGSYQVTIGGGGSWRNNGANSSFSSVQSTTYGEGSILAMGGGAGGATLTANGNGGGSGGGASRDDTANQGGASEQVNQIGYGMGNAGGNTGSTTNPGGGGGAMGAGNSGSAGSNPGRGGPGYDASDFEVGLYVGAGGNGNGGGSGTGPEGQTGTSSNGAANTGAGGGGSPGTGTRYSGGSGVVFVRYVI